MSKVGLNFKIECVIFSVCSRFQGSFFYSVIKTSTESRLVVPESIYFPKHQPFTSGYHLIVFVGTCLQKGKKPVIFHLSDQCFVPLNDIILQYRITVLLIGEPLNKAEEQKH